MSRSRNSQRKATAQGTVTNTTNDGLRHCHLSLPSTSIPTYMTILVSCHGGFPGDYHAHVPIMRRPMRKPKERHKPGIKIALRSSAHTSLGPCRHMALTHLKPEQYTSTWVPNTSPLASLSRDVIAKHQEAITSGPTASDSHGFPGHQTHPSADYPVPLPFGRNPPKRACKD